MKQQQLLGDEQGWWFVCDNNLLWLPDGKIPYGTAKEWGLAGDNAYYIGEHQNRAVWALSKKRTGHLFSLRTLLNENSTLFKLAGRAIQLVEFYYSHQYCGYCGERLQKSLDEWASICPSCQHYFYPQIAPCIIVAIRKEDCILLAKHKGHRENVYTVLSGFVEIGETLEDAVHREVKEESNLEVDNLSYFSSQPWPFPQSLMVGFIAEYQQGEIVVDPNELIGADWFSYNQLPELLPSQNTIARQLINTAAQQCRGYVVKTNE